LTNIYFYPAVFNINTIFFVKRKRIPVNPTLITGIVIVNFALVFYSIAIVPEQRRKVITKATLFYLALGIACDVTATIFMIIGSKHIPITVHGCIGYSALLAMFADTVLVWSFWIKFRDKIVYKKLHIYSRYAYTWWVAAYIAGALLVMVKK